MTKPIVITLLTDFGLDDPYVGVMKGAIFRECPAANVIDLTHSIKPFDRVAAAFWIERVFGRFPAGTAHVLVVDPGVGSSRRGLAMSAHGQFFVGPDNGILSGIFASDGRAEAREIELGALGLGTPSRTFHGRDIFAPVAARLAGLGLAFQTVGPIVQSLSESVLPETTTNGSTIVGQIVTVDRFGNLLTNIGTPAPAGDREVHVGGRCLPVLSTYADAKAGELFALFGSFDVLEIALREGHAASEAGLTLGMRVELRPPA